MYTFVLGRIHSHHEPCAAHGPQVRYPCEKQSLQGIMRTHGKEN